MAATKWLNWAPLITAQHGPLEAEVVSSPPGWTLWTGVSSCSSHYSPGRSRTCCFAKQSLVIHRQLMFFFYCPIITQNFIHLVLVRASLGLSYLPDFSCAIYTSSPALVQSVLSNWLKEKQQMQQYYSQDGSEFVQRELHACWFCESSLVSGTREAHFQLRLENTNQVQPLHWAKVSGVPQYDTTVTGGPSSSWCLWEIFTPVSRLMTI